MFGCVCLFGRVLVLACVCVRESVRARDCVGVCGV